MRNRTSALLTALIVTATTSGCGWSGLNESPLPFAAGNGEDALTLTVHLANAVNLVPNSEVKVNDVTVGSVRRIEFDDWHARLTVGLEPDVRLPANTRARIGQKSLLGAEYLELAPPTDEPAAGRLADGDVIPLSRTGRYPETEELFAALATVLNGGGLAQIETITSELNAAFGGRESDVRRLVTSLGTLIGTLDEQRDQIVAATEGVNELADTFADDRETLGRALKTFPRAVDVLRDEREQLTETLDSLSEFGDSTTKLMTANRAQLRRNLANLRPILHELGDAEDSLTGFLAGVGSAERLAEQRGIHLGRDARHDIQSNLVGWALHEQVSGRRPERDRQDGGRRRPARRLGDHRHASRGRARGRRLLVERLSDGFLRAEDRSFPCLPVDERALPVVDQEGRPDVRLDFGDRAIKVRHDYQVLLGGDKQIISFHLPGHTQSFKDMLDHMEIVHARMFYAYASMRNGCRADEADHFQVVGSDRELSSMQSWHAVYMKRIGSNLFDLRAQDIEKIT